MRVEEMALRSEVRQMLNEAGINRETLKDMVKESLDDIVSNQVNQVLMERKEKDLNEVVSDYINNIMHSTIRCCAESVIREKLRGMNFSVNITVHNKTESEDK